MWNFLVYITKKRKFLSAWDITKSPTCHRRKCRTFTEHCSLTCTAVHTCLCRENKVLYVWRVQLYIPACVVRTKFCTFDGYSCTYLLVSWEQSLWPSCWSLLNVGRIRLLGLRCHFARQWKPVKWHNISTWIGNRSEIWFYQMLEHRKFSHCSPYKCVTNAYSHICSLFHNLMTCHYHKCLWMHDNAIVLCNDRSARTDMLVSLPARKAASGILTFELRPKFSLND